MSLRRRLKNNRPPEGWELIQEVIEDFEQQMKEAVNDEHEGKRKNETSWKIHRIHWEKNRFIYDLMYVRKVMSRELYDWLVREKMADGPLIAKWRKPGYEILCSMLAIQKNNHNFGTTSHCRVPMKLRAFQQRITPDVQTGCICCASGDGRFGGPLWWNTPIEEDTEETAEANRAVWGQEGDQQPAPAQEGSRKRAAGGPPTGDDEDEDELDDAVKQRLAALRA
ncbi:hypothetical protein ACKKBF_B12970 [Auxenochlorella protothecoides x Auxenochlorella symbiontica]|uniref:G10 protein n=1 Tax=Auxenochlorella protothecoides TaxID=3075 RepID=A0A3M7KUB8_AUXPR|nr:hypothetical protein APUTEX25_004932 [Auxenochlorella protothecoides]|eukprot:RMZ53444.1 hypothetical protein APUTEX25_004932 [Auxenochlorella protothecoides]